MFPLDVPIVIQDGIIVTLFTAAAGLLLYKKLRKKTKSCPACQGECSSSTGLIQLPADKSAKISPSNL